MNSEPKEPAKRFNMDDSAKAKILALAANGCPLRTIARIVGCATSTIINAAKADAKFREELTRAQHIMEGVALRTLRIAAADPKYWRAAAWVTERQLPDEFGPPRKRTFTAEQVTMLVNEMFKDMSDRIAPDDVRACLDRLETLLNADVPPPPDELPPTEEATG
jgi:hypothetical protein